MCVNGDMVTELQEDLQEQKEEHKLHSRMFRQKTSEQEQILAEKDIEEFKCKLACSSSPSQHDSDSNDSTVSSCSSKHGPTLQEPIRRHGKAPPVDKHTREDPEIHFDDWFPGFQRAACCNGWTDDDTLIQLVGYFCGKALQEWNLLLKFNKATVQKAVLAIQEVLGPGREHDVQPWRQ